MDAKLYFESLISQGYSNENALTHTHRFYPDFTMNTAATVDARSWISQNFQRIAGESYPDDEGAVFTIVDIRENNQVFEVVAHSEPSIGYDPVRYDFIIVNGIPALESAYTPEPDGSWSPFFSTGITATPAASAHTPVVHQTHPPQQQQQQQQQMGQYPPQQQQQQQMGQYPPQQQQMGYVAAQQPSMQGQPMQAYGQGQPAQPYGQQGMIMQQQVGSRSKIVTFLLGFFLGVFGVHNFYLGKTGLGITQLLITVLTFGLGMIITGPWALIESILALASSNFRDGDGMPLSD